MNASIELKNINFGYNDNSHILSNLNLSISKSEKVFIHGASGSGKSTLLNLIGGVLTPQEGNVEVLQQNLSDLSMVKKDKFRGDNIGFIFQSFNLIPYLTIYENIVLALKVSHKRSKGISGQVDSEIKRIAKHLAIDELLDCRVTQLSVGQQQRVAVARALVGNPEIIIADEPTSSLDEEVTDSFMQLLLEEQNNKKFTLVFVSHDKRLARFFDREISLKNINGQGDKNA